ncbi:unnamed protein product [Phyllotreta striolata]|uniref:Carboxypeptidase Q n=1 Tax=Phyllotreta striolata TaxID=444603 RepID=A0A9N9XRM1_PHYSR|nr:unnamed protein product [Phyllotreta striolata]
MTTVLWLCLLVAALPLSSASQCNLPEELTKEIRSYREPVNQIIDAVTAGKYKGKTYDELAKFVDTFGARQVGGEVLEHSIDYLLELMQTKDYDLENVHGENVTVSRWIRGKESGEMIQPRPANIPVLTLGGSISTPTEGIEADVVVYRSFDELDANPSSAEGKIVVFNNDFVSYGVSVVYRTEGPTRAAKCGALAVLVRSVTSFSLNTLHTGQTDYTDGVKKIPAACITVEHAHMMQRYHDRNVTVRMRLNIQTQVDPDGVSRNTVAELKGSSIPDKTVIVSGHLDSWDVGVGAMDDGGGAFISWYSLVVLKGLGLRPKRTVRAVLWTSEEDGLIGVQSYNKTHEKELDDFVFVMESDEGTFTPLGLIFRAGTKGACILEEILKLLAPINATTAQNSDDAVGSDISIWKDLIPTASLLNDNDRYFWYHHSEADTMDVLDPSALDKATALWASVAYVIADLKDDFPRSFEKIEDSPGVAFQPKPTSFLVAVLVLCKFLFL